jgi:hypothetical protein
MSSARVSALFTLAHLLKIANGGGQKRIVAKVDELMQMCDQLKARLREPATGISLSRPPDNLDALRWGFGK